MPLSKEEQTELDALEKKFSARSTPKQMQSQMPVSPRRAVQTLPRSLAYGPQFKRATDVGTADDLEKGSIEMGGRITDLTGSPTLGTIARMVPDLATSFTGMGGGGAATVPLQGVGRELMQSALKPTLKQLRSGDAAVAIDTMLERGINATKGGVEKIKAEIGKLNNQIKEAISSSKATIARGDVGQELMSTLDKFSKQVNPEADMNAVRKAWQEFKNHPLFGDKAEIPVQLAQELKQGTYKQLASKYGQMGSAEVESQKALARGLKNQIAEKVPEIANLNKQESELIRTLGVAERRALMDLNKNPASLALLAHNPSAFAAFMADKSALFKSLVARMAYSGTKPIGQAAGGLGVSLYDISNPGSQPQPF